MKPIVCILPKDEGFSPRRFGAVALCVRDFTLHSRYREHSIVISGVSGSGFGSITYRPAPPARWYENRTRAYARHCASVINQSHATLAEIHNRPHLISLIAPKISCKLALHLHNDPHDMRDAALPAERKKILDRCDGIYCVSHFIRDRFAEGLHGYQQHKLHVVHNGIALPAAVLPKENLVVFAGRMTEGKGALLLAQALAIALPQMEGWRAVLIGSDRHSAAESLTAREMEILDALRPVASHAEMRGFLLHEETLGFFARAAIAVVPSIWQEPFGRTAIEAMAYGCALISSGRGALLEVTGDAALTPAELTAESLAASIVKLSRDPAALADWQRQARARAAYFEIDKCTEILDNARDRIISESARHAA